jgi:hypothetical protein
VSEALVAGVELDLPAFLRRTERHLTHLSALLEDPRLTPIRGSVVGIAAATAGVNIPGPEGGLEWHVRRITFAPPLQGGRPVAVTTQGTVIVGRGTGLAFNPTTGVMPLAGVGFEEITRTSTVPNALLFSRGQCAINYPENLVILWDAGTAGVTLQVSGDALEVPQNLVSADEG